jgi:hypothetical protein
LSGNFHCFAADAIIKPERRPDYLSKQMLYMDGENIQAVLIKQDCRFRHDVVCEAFSVFSE